MPLQINSGFLARYRASFQYTSPKNASKWFDLNVVTCFFARHLSLKHEAKLRGPHWDLKLILRLNNAKQMNEQSDVFNGVEYTFIHRHYGIFIEKMHSLPLVLSLWLIRGCCPTCTQDCMQRETTQDFLM